jgi:hypothetical protein
MYINVSTGKLPDAIDRKDSIYISASMNYKGILSLGCSVISVAFYYLCGFFSLLMPYWLLSMFHIG